MKCPIETAIPLYQSGLSLQKIADRLGHSATTVYLFLLKNNIPMRPSGFQPSPDVEAARLKAVSLRKAGHTFREIGDNLGVSRQRAHQLYVEAQSVLPPN